MVFLLFFFDDLDGSSFISGVCAVFDLALRVVPLLAELTVDPHLAVRVAILVCVEVDLATIVALFVVFEALGAILAVDYLLVEILEPNLGEMGLFLCLGTLFLQRFGSGGLRTAFSETSLFLVSSEALTLLVIVRAPKLVVARLNHLLLLLGRFGLLRGRLMLLTRACCRGYTTYRTVTTG